MSSTRPTNRGKKLLTTFLFLIVSAGVICPADAGETTWQRDPATPGDWFTDANWTNQHPTADDNALVGNGGTAEILSGSAEALELYLGLALPGTVRQSGGSMTVYNATLGLLTMGPGSYYLTDGLATIQNNLRLGNWQGSEGTFTLGGSGQVSAYAAYIGYYGTGHFVQTGGTATFPATEVGKGLTVGLMDSSTGTYDLSGGAVTSEVEFIGQLGVGRFIHTGGTNHVSELYLGYGFGGEGTYELSGSGELYAGLEWLGTGHFIQNGGTHIVSGTLEVRGSATCELYNGQLSAEQLKVGGYLSPAQFLQEGGTVSIVEELYVGFMYQGEGNGLYRQTGGTTTVGGTLCNLSVGIYELVDGELHTDSEEIAGVIRQSGGTHTIDSTLRLSHEDLKGKYELSGGSLTAKETVVDNTFEQSGGSNAVPYLSILQDSAYKFSGGTLTISEGLNNGGHFDFDGQGVGWSVPDNVLLNFGRDALYAHGSILNASQASLSVGANTLTVFPAGFDPASDFASFTTAGLTHTVGNTLVVPSGQGFGGKGEIDDPVVCSGTIKASYPPLPWPPPELNPPPDGFIHLHNGLVVQDGGSVDLGSGTLTVEDETSGLTDGELIAWELHMGKENPSATFTQTGGTSTFEHIILGPENGEGGKYRLSGGVLKVGSIVRSGTRGEYGDGGTLVVDGGTLEPEWPGGIAVSKFILGEEPGTAGTYHMRFGWVGLWADTIYVGYAGTGQLTQTGGRTRGNWAVYPWEPVPGLRLYVGYAPGSSGTYELEGGSIESIGAWIGWEGKGHFIQTGGEARFDGYGLRVGRMPGSEGTYELAAGELWADGCTVGKYGTGKFLHSGGHCIIRDTHDLNIGESGTYELSGSGYLWVGWTTYAYGDFRQSGGTHVADRLCLAGNYVISGGSLGLETLYGGGTLDITDGAADIRISQKFEANGTLSAVPGSAIHMQAALFTNQSQSPSKMAGLANVNMIFEGGQDVISDFEVAGRDVGSHTDGWIENFVLGTLTLGGLDPGWIRFVDDESNNLQWPGDEALYVYDLVINAGAGIDLNGLRLYYLNGGDPKEFFLGDANLDGAVNVGDLSLFSLNYGQSGTDWASCDFNGDGVTNVGDIGILGANFGSVTIPAGGGASGIPEPTTVSLLLVGALGALLRKRKV